ncbi:hypothetical protein B0A48_08437 [Cryoendolithus antarcticus]|uniref:Uncharacterized protein n=1 Tax=Cryoendolithus antarcticus TaxID=1507870 RepID=A0A1V8T5N4_9PEZI|nr:hypothetical protein B0A48_08437 [Cryoendolithus antarcticus]
MGYDAGGLAQMTYNNNNQHGFPTTSGLGAAGNGFGNRGSRFNSKRLSVALPPKVTPISEDSVDYPTPRTSRSHLLAGLRTQPKTPAVPASAPYNQTQHNVQGGGQTQWAGNHYNGYEQGVPRTAAASGFGMPQQYGMSAARQNYSLPGQVLAPPTYDPVEDMDPNMVEQLQMTSMFLAQRQQELQQKLAALSLQSQAQNQASMYGGNQYAQTPVAPQIMQNAYGQQMQEVQPGVYLVFNPATQSYSYVVDSNARQQAQQTISPSQQTQANPFASYQQQYAQQAPGFSVSPPSAEKTRSFTPPKKSSSPLSTEPVQPLPPPSATAFRRGHKTAKSLAVNPFATALEGPKTSTAATFGTQRTMFPPTPMTGTFAPGAARAGDHPIRQPRGPPSLDELTAAPTTKHEGSKNFATRQRRRALDSLMRAGTSRRAASGSPVSEGSEFGFSIPEEAEPVLDSAPTSRKMSPIGSEMLMKRSSQGSSEGYFGCSSACSSESEEVGAFKQPSTPATPVGSLLAGLEQAKSAGL